MTDGSQNQKSISKGWKASLQPIYMLICQNSTPPLVAYFLAHFPIFNEATWFQIVVFVEGLGSMFIIWISWRNFVSLIGDAITAVLDAIKDWKSRFKPSQP